MTSKRTTRLYGRIREILEAARSGVVRTVNTTQVVANWLIGREIVEEEQRGQARARYGERIVKTLSSKLTAEYVKGFSTRSLEYSRTFYLVYSSLLQKSHALRSISLPNDENQIS